MQSVHSLCKALATKGKDVTVYTTNFNGEKKAFVPLNREVIVEGVKVYYFNLTIQSRYAFSIPMLMAARRSIKNFQLIHIHTLFSFPTLIFSFYARRYGIPYIISPRGMLIRSMIEMKSPVKKKGYIFLFEKKNLVNASSVHCTSVTEKDEIESFRFPVKNVFVVPNGIQLKDFNSLSHKDYIYKKYPELRNKRLILFLGRINWKKGLNLLISAFAFVVKVHSNACLIIAGPDNEGYGAEVKRKIKNSGLKYIDYRLRKSLSDFNKKDAPNGDVIFTGYLEGKEKHAFLSGSDIFVLPSYSENFGMSVVEAMACKTPVIISNNVGIHRDVERYNGGIVIENTIDNLCRSMKRVLEDETLKRELSKKGLSLVNELYDADISAGVMTEYYKTIVDRHDASYIR